MRRRSAVAALAAGLWCGALAIAAPPARAQSVTPVVLPDGRSLTPAGRLVAAGDFPAASAVGNGTLFVADAGEGPNLIGAYETTTLAADYTTPVASPSSNYAPWTQSGSLALSPDGASLYAGGGAGADVVVFRATPRPVQTGSFSVSGRDAKGGTTSAYAGAVRVDAGGTHLFVSEPFDASAPFAKGSWVERIGTGDSADTLVRVGRVPDALAIARAPAPGAGDVRELLAVGNRDDGSVSIVDAEATPMRVLATIDTGRQPAALAFDASARHLYVLDSLDDALVDIATSTWKPEATLALDSGGLGAAPSALAVSDDGATLYVALSGENAIAVVDARGGLQLRGLIPTAAYPTSVAIDTSSALGPHLLITAGKGIGQNAGTPPGAPIALVQPAAPGPTGLGVAGAVEAIAMPTDAQLAAYTSQVLNDNRVAFTCTPSAAMTQIKHVLYVVRENKTYDEQFGDEPGGDPAGLLYGRTYTPNAHALAERFALLEDFFADEEVSDTGHQALMGGDANDWVQRLSQQAYGLDGAARQGAELGNDSDLLWSPSNYLLDSALAAGIDFRDYGEFYRRDQHTDGAVSAALGGHIVNAFPGFGFDPGTPDTKRIAFWQRQFADDVAHDTLPALEVLYLPEDHTTDGVPLPMDAQQVADADLALGQLVQSISRSRYWSSTAIFMTEDDPQSGVDHVDEHRTIGLVIGPTVLPATETTQHYDQFSMLRTIEEILHLPPLTQFDATAQPMDALFGGVSSTLPYAAVTPTPPGGSVATAAQEARLRSALLGPSSDVGDIAPAAQLQLQWLEMRGVPYAPPHWTKAGPELSGRQATDATASCGGPPPQVPELPGGVTGAALVAPLLLLIMLWRVHMSRRSMT